MLEPLHYDSVTLHEPIGPFTYTVPADYNAKRLAALSVTDASFLAGPDGRAYAEPSFLCGQHSWVVRQRYSWGGSVHAKCDVEFLKPVYPGSRIHVAAEVAGKYERRGGHYVVFQVTTRDEAGDVVSRVENTMLLNLREVLEYRKRMAAPGARAEAPAAPAARPGAAAGAEERAGAPEIAVSFGPKTLRASDILGFFRVEEEIYGPHACIHNDAAIAKAAGLADIVAPGRYLIAFMNCMFGRVLGEPFFGSARYSVSFLNHLLPGIVASARATVTAGADSTAKGRTFAVSCRDAASGKALLSGTARL